MGLITIPVWPEGSLAMFAKEGEEFPSPTAIFSTKVIEVPDIKVEWINGVTYQGVYRVSIRYKHQMHAFSFTPEAIPSKAAGIQPFINSIANTLQKMAYIDEEAMPWFRQQLLGKCFPGNKPTHWPEHEPKPDFQEMALELPVDLNQKVRCPRCGKARKKTTLGDVIIHLNDRHKVTRENIAQWLDNEADKGNINIDFKTPEEQEREKNERSREEGSGSKDAALAAHIASGVNPDAAYSFVQSGHLTKEEFDKIFADFKASSLGVWNVDPE